MLINDFSSERIFNLRLRRNSHRTSFDFKTFVQERLINNIKIPQSISKIDTRQIHLIDNDIDENSVNSPSDDDDDIEEISSPKLSLYLPNDDYLDKLAEWEPNNSMDTIENDDEEEAIIEEKNDDVEPMNLPEEMHTNDVEDLIIISVHGPVKNEPIIDEDTDVIFPQLDGQTDFLWNNNPKTTKRKKNQTWRMSSTKSEGSIWKYMDFKNDIDSTDQKGFPSIKKRKRSSTEFKSRLGSRNRKSFSMEPNGKTILDYFKVVNRSSTNDKNLSMSRTRSRSDNYFDNCIVIDDDDDEEEKEDNQIEAEEVEQEQQQYELCYPNSTNIHTREKLLDHVIHTSEMRIKWLRNVELILLEHIFLCHENLHKSSSYHIDSSFISTIILNFLKMFIIRNDDNNQNEFLFNQFSFTSYLHYLLIHLPTYEHQNSNDDNFCSDCEQYSLILNILFDLLYDLLEYDLCEINNNKDQYRSPLIQNDYFKQLKLNKRNPFFRIKFIIYLIELIGLHRSKCQKDKEENFLIIQNRIFQWLENFIQHILSNINNLKNERLSICLNVMELSILFINDKEYRLKQMVSFLTNICGDNPIYLSWILFDKNLLVDIRFMLLNEVISKKFNMKLNSIDDIEQCLNSVHILLQSSNSIDEMTLLLTRSLFNTYADLIIDRKRSTCFEVMSTFLRNQFESIYLTLKTLSNTSEQYKRTVILFSLLKSKWNQI